MIALGAVLPLVAANLDTTLSPAADGNSNWRRTVPVTLTLSATDDVGVASLKYSLGCGRR